MPGAHQRPLYLSISQAHEMLHCAYLRKDLKEPSADGRCGEATVK